MLSSRNQLINANEGSSKIKVEFYDSVIDDGIDDDDIYTASVQTLKSPSPCCTMKPGSPESQ